MNNPEKTSQLKLANIEFKAGNYKKSISLYQKAMEHNPELTAIATLNIAIANTYINDNASITSGNDALTPRPTVEGPTSRLDDLSIPDAPLSSGKIYEPAALPVEAILTAALQTSCKRLLKEYESDVETTFLEKIDKLPLNTKKRARKFTASIIMPTYNRSATLKNAIDSVVSQTHKLWELIIIDDGSTDDTPKILNSYKKEKRIKVIKGYHKGVSAARNQGLAIASGDYIYYLDSDNTWKTNFLEIMNLSFLLSGRDTGYSSLLLHDEHSNIIGYRGEPFDWDECLNANYVDINVFAHKRTLLISEGPFDISLRRMVDWDLILRYTKISPPFFAPFIGCNYLESRNDINRITLSEPLAFQKVVRLKNKLVDQPKTEISKNISLRIAIKIPAPEAEKEQWGDYHYADSLRIALEKMGHIVALDFHGAWYSRPASAEDVVIVIRGLTTYKPRKGTISVLWNISHPDQISIDEYESYDLAYVASNSYAELLKFQLNTKVSALLQCSDPERFSYERPSTPRAKSMLFVGNSRNEYRPIVKKAIESGKDIAIYGTRWKSLVDPKYIKAENIANTQLCNTYASHSIVLNDHWESMRDYGFISNRVFDVLASGSTLITDPIPSIKTIFGDTVVQLEDHASFESITSQLEDIEDFGENRKRSIASFVNQNHSFNNRANVICDDILRKLGLPGIWSSDPVLDSGATSFEPMSPRIRVAIFIDSDRPLSQVEYIRLISPLTTESAQQTAQVFLTSSINDIALNNCDAIIVPDASIKRKGIATELISYAHHNDVKIYIDVHRDFFNTSGTRASTEQKSSFKLLLGNADHVWFSTERLALSLCGMCKSSSVVPNSLDKRLWRNYRAPQPRPALAPRYRLLILANDKYENDLEYIIPALDIIAADRGNVFELVIIGNLDIKHDRTWIKSIKPNEKRTAYHQYAEWLMKAEKFDIGIIPKLNAGASTCESDEDFLHMTALGMPVICSRSWVYELLAKSGLVIASPNTIDNWTKSIAMAMDHPELMVDIADRAWKYIWEHRTSEATGHHLASTIAQPKRRSTRPSEKNIPSKAKNAVCLHLYYTEQWPAISKRLNNISQCFDLFVTCTPEAYNSAKQIVNNDYENAIIVQVENSGMDVLPFLFINKEYSLWRYNAVLKLHTKNTKTPDDLIFGSLCYESLLSSSDAVKAILRKFESEPDVGMIGPESLYRSAQSLMYVNGTYVREIVDILEINNTSSDWGFFAGTMFWVRGSLLFTLAQKFTKLLDITKVDSSIVKSGGDGTWAHAMERVFGAIPNSKRMKNHSLFLTDFETRQWSIRDVPEGEFLKSLSYRVSSKWHLGRFANIERWAQLCLNSEFFDEQYYQEHSGGMIPAGMRPVVHYILYGDDLALNPSAHFSTSYYKARHPDTLNARVPFLVHYLVCGIKEGRAICAANQY